MVALVLAMVGLLACAPDRDEPSASAGDIQASAAPSQLGLCASCHGHNGIAVIADTPNLAGRKREELLDAMQAYLDGRRDYPPMRAMLGPIRPADRERLADWFSAQSAPSS